MSENIVRGIRVPEQSILKKAGVEKYVRELALIRQLAGKEMLAFDASATFLVGENGVGKSTLMEALAIAADFPAIGGPHRGWKGDSAKELTGTESRLAQKIFLRTTGPISRGFFLRAETYLLMAAAADSPEVRHGRNQLEANVFIQRRSHGQGVFDVLGEAISGPGFYLMDEPEAGLSVVRQMALSAEITLATRVGAQFVIATHSPILPAVPGARIYDISEEGIFSVSFDQVDNVAAAREFLADPGATMKYLVDG